jgi:magnesium transporter
MRLGALIAPDLKDVLKDDPEQVHDFVEELHPEDLADVVRELEPEEAAAMLSRLPAVDAAPIFERLEDETQEDLASRMGVESVAQIASAMAADDRVSLFEVLPEELGDKVWETLEKVDPEAAEDVLAIEEWPDGTAGRLMNTDIVSVTWRATVADAIRAIREHLQRKSDPIYKVYVLRPDGRLEGFATTQDLLLARPGDAIEAVLTTNVIAVEPEVDTDEVAKRMAKYDLNVMPVIDKEGVLHGIITIDDVMDVLTARQTEDVQRLGAVEPLDVPYFKTSFSSFIRKRGVWLVVLFLEEFFTQTALRYYDPVFEAIKGASYYVPLLISTGGNSGSQSSTLIIRGLAVGEIQSKDWWRIFLREAAMGLVLGIGLGAIGFLRVLMYPDQSLRFALTIALTLVGIVVTGCSVGSMLPLVLKRCGVDPATSSTPFIASLVDVLGIIVFVHAAKLVMAAALTGAGVH